MLIGSYDCTCSPGWFMNEYYTCEQTPCGEGMFGPGGLDCFKMPEHGVCHDECEEMDCEFGWYVDDGGGTSSNQLWSCKDIARLSLIKSD